MIALVRFIHGLITLFFLACLAYVYYAGIRNEEGLWSWLAMGALLAEGVVVALNHGDCPLGAIHRRFGDDRTFFELVMPRYVAKHAVPFMAGVALIGLVLLLT